MKQLRMTITANLPDDDVAAAHHIVSWRNDLEVMRDRVATESGGPPPGFTMKVVNARQSAPPEYQPPEAPPPTPPCDGKTGTELHGPDDLLGIPPELDRRGT